jgi:selenocysteine-specific translation elongation factor
MSEKSITGLLVYRCTELAGICSVVCLTLQPLLVVLNKADILKLEELSPEKRALLAPIESENIPLMEMSTVTENGVMEVKQEVSFFA